MDLQVKLPVFNKSRIDIGLVSNQLFQSFNFSNNCYTGSFGSEAPSDNCQINFQSLLDSKT